jgi:oligoribonuclease
MTGLRPEHDRIIEIATIVTDQELNILAEGPVMAIHQPEEVLAGMDEWNQSHHGQSGLLERVRESTIDEATAARLTMEFLQQLVPSGASPMCGNSVGQDRRFLYNYMPELEHFFHYRNLDVSTVKILAQRWYPSVAAGLMKGEAHLALADIRESIAELRYYREHLLVPQS